MYFIKLGCSECCNAWLYNSTIHSNVYFYLYCPVSVQLVSDVWLSTYALNTYSARFIPHLGKRKTVDGIWFLILIAYVYTADTCLNVLRCVQVYEPVEFNSTRVNKHCRNISIIIQI